MKSLILLVLVFSSPVIAETNLDKTFLDITMNCRTYRMFDSPDKSQEVENDCIRNKLKENKLSKAKYNNWSKDYWTRQEESWEKFLKNLEKK